MKFVTLSVLSLLVSVVSAFHIVSPGSITSCNALALEYDLRTGKAPFACSFHNNTADGPIIAALTGDDITGFSYTWDRVTIAAGTTVVITLSDSSGKGSSTPPINVGQGSSDCLANPTSVPPIPSVTTTYPPSTLPASLLSSTTPVSLPSGLSSSLNSLSSVINSANSAISSLTSSSTSVPTGGLGTNGGVANAAGVFTVGAISAVIGALLA